METLVKRALKQIQDKQYANAYAHLDKKIYLLGVGFLEKQQKGKEKSTLEIDCGLEEWKAKN